MSAWVLAMIWATTGATGQDEEPFVRYPELSPDGTQIAFSYQGDIWVAGVDGSTPRRLTIHEAYEAFPKWSPDGQQLVFVSSRHGNEDLFVMRAEGSKPRLLTCRSCNDGSPSWTPDGAVLFTTLRDYSPFSWESEIHRVPGQGGTPQRFMNALGSEPCASPTGRFIAFVRGAAKTTRKHYRGPANRDLWILDTERETYTQVTRFEGNDFHPVWLDAQHIAFISERSGTYNVHVQPLNALGEPEGEARPLTSFDGDGVRWFSADRAGHNMVMERATFIYTQTLDPPSQPQRLSLTLPGDDRRADTAWKRFNEDAESFCVSPNGHFAALEIRGELFLTFTDPKKDLTIPLTHNPFRDRQPVWLNDKTLMFCSDRNGQYDLYLLRGTDGEKDLIWNLDFEVIRLTHTPQDESQPLLAPDGKKLVFLRGLGQLILTPLDEEMGLKSEIVLLDSWSPPTDLTWSPDSNWLAFAQEDLFFNSEVFLLQAAKDAKPVNVSMHPRSDHGPRFSPDGRKLGFLSARKQGDTDVWMLWLREADSRKTRLDWEEEEGTQPDAEDKSKAKQDDQEDDAPNIEPVLIDFADIHRRVMPVTALPGHESDLIIGDDNKTFFFVTNRRERGTKAGDQDIYSIQFDGKDLKRLTQGNLGPQQLTLDTDHKHLYFLNPKGGLQRLQIQGEKTETIPFSARMEVDLIAERQQVFEEAWRTLDRYFYDPKFHGADWNRLHDQYASWSRRASTQQDFIDVMNLMLGELNASHMRFGKRQPPPELPELTGLIGAELHPTPQGMQVNRVISQSPADRPWSQLASGDLITAVNGVPYEPGNNFYRLLEGTAEDKTALRIQSENGETRELILRPAGDLGDALYEDWVDSRRELTRVYSDGRIGYVHLNAMSMETYEAFETELTASAQGKQALIVDVRYNGGGWTTDYMMAVLTARQHAYTIPRGATDDLETHRTEFRSYYPFGERLPMPAWTRPVAAICNQYSYSNAEIFSHAFKSLELGPLVGYPTFGAVISTGFVPLMDGSYVRAPYRGWFVLPNDQNMENGPAQPDIIVAEPPGELGSHEDIQLQTAVQTLLETLNSVTPD